MSRRCWRKKDPVLSTHRWLRLETTKTHRYVLNGETLDLSCGQPAELVIEFLCWISSVRRHLIRYLPSKVQFLIIYFFYLLTVQRVEAVNFSKHRVSCKTIKIKILKGHIVTRCLRFVCQYLKSVAHYFEAVIKFHWKRTNLGCVLSRAKRALFLQASPPRFPDHMGVCHGVYPTVRHWNVAISQVSHSPQAAQSCSCVCLTKRRSMKCVGMGL